MAIIRYKNPTEYSFHLWIKNYPESFHPADTARFMQFVKTVCRHNSRKWKDSEFLRLKILDYKPDFNEEILEKILITFEDCIEFYNAIPLGDGHENDDRDLPSGEYFERSVTKYGEFKESVKKYTF